MADGTNDLTVKKGDKVTLTGEIVGVNTPYRWANVRFSDGSLACVSFDAVNVAGDSSEPKVRHSADWADINSDLGKAEIKIAVLASYIGTLAQALVDCCPPRTSQHPNSRAYSLYQQAEAVVTGIESTDWRQA